MSFKINRYIIEISDNHSEEFDNTLDNFKYDSGNSIKIISRKYIQNNNINKYTIEVLDLYIDSFEEFLSNQSFKNNIISKTSTIKSDWDFEEDEYDDYYEEENSGLRKFRDDY